MTPILSIINALKIDKEIVMVTRLGRPTGWLRVIEVVLTLMLALNGLYLVVYVLSGPGSFARGQFDLSEFFGPEAYLARNHADIQLGDVTVVLAHYSFWQSLLEELRHGLAATLATIPMIYLARRLIYRAVDHGPFTPDMVRGLRRLGLVVLVGGALCSAVEVASSNILLRISLPAELLPHNYPDYQVSLWWVVPGLVLLAFAQIVRHGVSLRDDLDGLV
jgi:hypothetical protein